METFAILRRNGWATLDDLGIAANRSAVVAEHMPGDVAWIRTYALAESDGSVGTVCIYQASSPEAVRRHAAEAALPVDEIVNVADTVVVREDPVPAAT